MVLVDIPGSAGTYPGTVEIILRATGLGLFTAAEAELLIARARTHITTPILSIQDSNRAGVAARSGEPSPSVPIGQFDDHIDRYSSAATT